MMITSALPYYHVARTREGLDDPQARSVGGVISTACEYFTDGLSAAEYDGATPHEMGESIKGVVSGYSEDNPMRVGAPDAHVTVWVRRVRHPADR